MLYLRLRSMFEWILFPRSRYVTLHSQILHRVKLFLLVFLIVPYLVLILLTLCHESVLPVSRDDLSCWWTSFIKLLWCMLTMGSVWSLEWCLFSLLLRLGLILWYLWEGVLRMPSWLCNLYWPCFKLMRFLSLWILSQEKIWFSLRRMHLKVNRRIFSHFDSN